MLLIFYLTCHVTSLLAVPLTTEPPPSNASSSNAMQMASSNIETNMKRVDGKNQKSHLDLQPLLQQFVNNTTARIARLKCLLNDTSEIDSMMVDYEHFARQYGENLTLSYQSQCDWAIRVAAECLKGVFDALPNERQHNPFVCECIQLANDLVRANCALVMQHIAAKASELLNDSVHNLTELRRIRAVALSQAAATTGKYDDSRCRKSFADQFRAALGQMEHTDRFAWQLNGLLIAGVTDRFRDLVQMTMADRV